MRTNIEEHETHFCLLLLQLLASLSFLDDPFTNFINTFSRTGFVLQQITLKSGDLKKKISVSAFIRGIVVLLTLSSSSGIASAKRLASSEISSSVRIGIACVNALRLGNGRFCCEVSLGVVGEATVEGLYGKKHLKMPSACHFVACVKLTHTSIRPGRLRAGSRRSI